MDTKIGILGGTFNPPHLAHLLVAESVRDEMGLSKILFVPAAMPPHKPSLDIVPAEMRLHMLRLAIKGNPFFRVSEIELDRKGPSFTIDTVSELRSGFPKVEFFLLLGADLLVDFGTWKSPEKLLVDCRVVGMSRPGFDLSRVSADILRRVEIVSVPDIDISSTIIRRRIKSGKSIKYMVTREVEKYIHDNSLYL